jgi:uncharacterized membrane protein (GlpM family)
MVWLELLLRAATAATIVVTASMLAERAGPLLGGLIVSLPVSAGPAYVMLALRQDAPFIAASALGSLAGNAVTLVYILTIVLLAPRLRWPLVLAVALAVWVIAASLVAAVNWGLVSALLLNATVFGICAALSRGAMSRSSARVTAPRRRWYDLPLRALTVGALVATVVTASRWLGPSVTGMAAVFPIVLTGLAIVSLPRLGGPATAVLFASTLRAMMGFVLSLFVLHMMAVPFGVWWGMGAALGAQIVFSAALLAWGRRKARLARTA